MLGLPPTRNSNTFGADPESPMAGATLDIRLAPGAHVRGMLMSGWCAEVVVILLLAGAVAAGAGRREEAGNQGTSHASTEHHRPLGGSLTSLREECTLWLWHRGSH